MTNASWGFFGKPPKKILEGGATHWEQTSYKKYLAEAKKLGKLVNVQQRTLKLAELKAKYLREFPVEE